MNANTLFALAANIVLNYGKKPIKIPALSSADHSILMNMVIGLKG